MKKTLVQLSVMSALSTLSIAGVYANAGPPPMCPPSEAPACVGCGCPETSKFFRTGLYAGLQAGYNYLHTKYNGYRTNAIGATTSYSRSDSSNGAIGGLFLGGRYVYPSCWVVGLEVDGVVSTNDTEESISFATGARNFRLDKDRRWGIIPMLVGGYIFKERCLVYGKAGLAISKFKNHIRDRDNATSYHNEKTRVGFAPSIGLEYALTSSMSARVEMGAEWYGKISTKNYVLPLGDAISMGSKSYMFNTQLGVVLKL